MKIQVNKKILSLILVIGSVLNLSGCQLAKEDSQYKETENLCGTFITYELDGKEYTFDDENKKYYGTFDENILDEGLDKYNFGDLKGYAIFLHKKGEGENKTNVIAGDNIFRNTKFSLNVNTEENSKEIITTEDTETVPEPDINITSEENKIEATIYVTSKFKGIIQFNPIIKEGEKYYTVREGNSIHVDGKDECSSSISASSNDTNKIINNKGSNSKSEKFTYTVTVEPVDELKSIKIKEMNSSDKVIKTKGIVHKGNNYEFKMSKNTAYIIVEETCIDKNGKEITKRTIYDRDKINNDETNHLCNYANEDNIVIPKNLYIKK